MLLGTEFVRPLSNSSDTSVALDGCRSCYLCFVRRSSGVLLRRSGFAAERLYNKAIVDYTVPALCTPVTLFPPTRDAAYRQHAGGGPSHGHRQYAQKFGKDRACGSGDILADRQTDTQTDILITILRNRSRGRSNYCEASYKRCNFI